MRCCDKPVRGIFCDVWMTQWDAAPERHALWEGDWEKPGDDTARICVARGETFIYRAVLLEMWGAIEGEAGFRQSGDCAWNPYWNPYVVSHRRKQELGKGLVTDLVVG